MKTQLYYGVKIIVTTILVYVTVKLLDLAIARLTLKIFVGI
jgi:hypothetical protein